MLEKMIDAAKKNYKFAKYLNYAYQFGETFFGLVFTPEKVPAEIKGGTIIVINSNNLKTVVLPVRPQTMSVLENQGTVQKIFSVNNETVEESELKHYGILGQKWGIRRYQNSDGSLTTAGKKRYVGDDGKLNEKAQRNLAITPRGQMTDRGKKLFLDKNGKLNDEGRKYFRVNDQGRIVKRKVNSPQDEAEAAKRARDKAELDKVNAETKRIEAQTRADNKQAAAQLKAETKANAVKERDLLNSNPKTLTDQELQAITNRLGLEQRYAQLTAEKQSAGKKALKAAIPIIGAAAVGIGGKILLSRAQGSWNNYVNAGGLTDGSKLPKFTQLGSPYYSKIFEDNIPKVGSAVQAALNAYNQIQKDKQ